MNEHPKIVKRQQPTAPEVNLAPLPSVHSSSATVESIESVEMPAPLEQLEVLDMPSAPITPTYSQWCREFELDNWADKEDTWEFESDDLYMMRDG